MQFKKDLFKVLSSNFINLLIGIINGFLIPAFLSLDQYASLKTFTLYISYAGILHFGFIDGIFLKYGGKRKEEIDTSKLKGEHKFLVLFLLAITLLTTGIGVMLKDGILIAFAITILPINIQTLYRFLYQALGEFSIFSKIMVFTPNLLLFLNLLIIFVLKINNYWYFVLANVIAYYIVFIGLEIFFWKTHKGIPTLMEIREIWGHFKVGIFIMAGNFSSMFFYSSDRWFVKLFLTSKDFAYYSFAISMMTVINTLINSVTMTFYPYLARGQEASKLQLLKKYLLIIGVLSSGTYFVFHFFVSAFMTKYVPSLRIVSILFAGFPAMIIINALFINSYKINRQEKRYVLTVGLMSILSVLLNIAAILIQKNSITIAFATTIAFYIWYFFSCRDLPNMKSNLREGIYLVLFFFTYYTCIEYLSWMAGFLAYYVIIFAITFILYKKDLFMLVKDILRK